MNAPAIGMTASLKRCFSTEDVAAYRILSGDTQLLYGDFKSEVPGPMLGGLISCLLGTKLPGRGTNWLKQSYRFEAPCRLGEEVTARVTVTRLRPEKKLVYLSASCTTESGAIVCEGETLVLYDPPDVQ